MQVFHVRGGRIRGQRGFIVDKVEDVTTADLVEHLLQQLYGDGSAEAVPREVLVPALPASAETHDRVAHRAARQQRRRARAAARRQARPDGDRDAQRRRSRWPLHKTRRAGDLTTRSQALEELAGGARPARGAAAHRVLRRLPPAGRRRRGEPGGLRGRAGPQERVPPVRDPGRRRRHLRRRPLHRRGHRPTLPAARSRSAPTRDDGRTRASTRSTGRPREVRLPAEPGRRRRRPAAGRGGAGGAVRARASPTSRVVGLAKRLEEVWLPDEEDPVILPRTSEGLYLLQRVRDEAHRFAIRYQRQKRGKRMVESILDDVPGLGEARKKALLRQFGSLKRLRAASVERSRGARDRPDHGAGRRRRAGGVRAGAGRQPDDRRDPRLSGPVARTRSCGAAHGRGAGHVRGSDTHRRSSSGTGVRGWSRSLELVLVTGMSGAGRSTAARALEDLGWFVIDNLPPEMLPQAVDLLARSLGPRRGWRSWSTCAVAGCSTSSSGALDERDRPRRRPAGPVPRGQRRGARPPVREQPASAPAAGRGRPPRRDSSASAPLLGDLRAGADLVIDTSALQRPRPAPRDRRGLRRVRPRAAAGHGDVLRVQVRAAAGCRHRRRRPVPAQPLLGARAARADAASTPRSTTTSWPSRRPASSSTGCPR